MKIIKNIFQKNIQSTTSKPTSKPKVLAAEQQDSVAKVIDGISADKPNKTTKSTPNNKQVTHRDLPAKIEHLKELIAAINDKAPPPNSFNFNQTYKIRYQQDLNEAQLTAVSTTDKPLLVIAGAGSGKTRVIVYKVAYLIETGVEPSSILLLTFTRKAAQEMLGRVKQLLGGQTQAGVIGGTFHSFANDMLRRYHKLIDIPYNFTICDAVDAGDILGLLKNEIFGSRKFKQPFPRKTALRDIISKSRNLELPIAEIIDRYFYNYRNFTEEIETLSAAFTKYKARNQILDYDDLIEVLKDKLSSNELFRQKLQAQIQYVLVDEYQDVNNTQRRIVELIVGQRKTITVVGDDAQSIYSFRGANYENILSFADSFANYECVKLEQNYRSNDGILKLVNEVISHASLSFKKELYTEIKSNSKPVIKQLADPQTEAMYIADEILELRSSRNLDYDHFAVLTRAGWHSNFIQTEFTARRIPFVVRGGIKFVERAHIKDVIAFLKIILNPLDAIAWHRILTLLDGIGQVRASLIMQTVRANQGQINFKSLISNKWHKNLLVYEKFYKQVSPNIAPAEAIAKLQVFYEQQMKKTYLEDYDLRLQDLNSLTIIADKYRSLEKFLSDFTLEPPASMRQNSIVVPDGEKCVVVSTIHSAKGLEWPTVFLAYALDGLLPSARSSNSLEELEEERRLFYVATSRARDNLFITNPSYVMSFNDYFAEPSRFIEEINKKYYRT